MPITFTVQNREGAYDAALALKRLHEAVEAQAALLAEDPEYTPNAAVLYNLGKAARLVQKRKPELIEAGCLRRVTRLLRRVDNLFNAEFIEDPEA